MARVSRRRRRKYAPVVAELLQDGNELGHVRFRGLDARGTCRLAVAQNQATLVGGVWPFDKRGRIGLRAQVDAFRAPAIVQRTFASTHKSSPVRYSDDAACSDLVQSCGSLGDFRRRSCHPPSARPPRRRARADGHRDIPAPGHTSGGHGADEEGCPSCPRCRRRRCYRRSSRVAVRQT
ncbi:MAG: hypothetical protein ACLT98_09405 [Eggerthellaceae bacterium]